MIYIKYGPPDEREEHPTGDAARVYPFEKWRYRYIEGVGADVNIEFVDPTMTGEYRMTRDPFNQLPMKARTDFIPVTNVSTMAYITIQFQNKDLQFEQKEGVTEATVNLYGRITSITGRPVNNFDGTVKVNVPADMLQNAGEGKNIYQKSVPLQPGRYRLNIAAKDLVGNNATNYEVALDVPRLDEEHLSASSLILADMIEKVPRGPFVIGTSKVRPRMDNTFHRDEKIGIYLQLYNFEPDEKTRKPDGTIRYEISKEGSDDKTFDFSQDAEKAPGGASQIVVEQMLPLQNLEPGQYSLKITATDKKRNETLTRSVSFTIL